MATKLKNIKYSGAVKIVALIIAITMFFSSGYFANLFVRGLVDYNAYDYGISDYTHTNTFRELMNTVETFYINEFDKENRKFDSYEEFRVSDYFQAASDYYNVLIDNVSKSYDILEKSGIEVYVTSDNSYRYLYPYKNFVYIFNHKGNLLHEDNFFVFDISRVYPDDGVTAESTTVVAEKNTQEQVIPDDSKIWVDADGNGRYQKNGGQILRFYEPGNGEPPLEVYDIGEALNAIGSITDFTCYGESTKERFIAEIEADREQFLIEQYNAAETYSSYNAGIDRYKSVNYAIILNNSVKTNCGVTASDTEAQIIEKLGGSFIEASVNGNYKLLKGTENKSVPSIYENFSVDLFGGVGNVLKDGIGRFDFPEKTSAYFSVNLEQNVTDPFTLSYRAYSSFMSAPINNITACLAFFALSFLIAFAAVIFLLSVTGKTADGTKICFLDRIPAVINWAVGAAVAGFSAFAAALIAVTETYPEEIAQTNLLDYGTTTTLLRIASGNTDFINGILIMIAFITVTALLASLIRNIRNKTFWKYTLCAYLLRLLRFIFRPFTKLFKNTIDKIRYAFVCDYSKGESKKFRTIAFISVAGFVIATIIYYSIGGLMADYEEFVAFFMYVIGIPVDLAIIGFAILIISSLDRIMAFVSQVRQGNLDGKIDMKFMPPFVRRFAEDVLSMQDGLQNAVDSAVKDQRMKAELITNVSHDLKTPLTSIVNYVDLLKKCNVEDKTAQKYIGVLDEKAARMKKLIEDLVEASKASSGAIEIHPVRINLCEFAAQTVGEHEDELQGCNVGIVLKAPPAPVTVTADPQKTSRIVENLFSNIRKYALEGTRVHVEVTDGTDYGSIVFKNISKYPIDVSAEELTQRFVRGDSSRSGEGSGLGLSIAQNLCELQKGLFRVEVDSDLFKVTLSLPKTE